MFHFGLSLWTIFWSTSSVFVFKHSSSRSLSPKLVFWPSLLVIGECSLLVSGLKIRKSFPIGPSFWQWRKIWRLLSRVKWGLNGTEMKNQKVNEMVEIIHAKTWGFCSWTFSKFSKVGNHKFYISLDFCLCEEQVQILLAALLMHKPRKSLALNFFL